jgi:phosphopantothenoylcysteine decarboxylase/phosphopantothenate--cysteine ligase
MTPSAKEFITPVTLSALSGKPVVSEFFTANTGEWHSHVDLGLWADAMVIAPATACTIGKMANGVADNMLVTTYLSAKSQVFVAPAMDLDMMAHPSTTANIEKLKSYGNIIIEPAAGELASHLVGKGRMEEPENIVAVLRNYFDNKQYEVAAVQAAANQAAPENGAAQNASLLAGKRVMITAGPTLEKIDPVRYISNYSSGKMGYALADEFASRGAIVTLVSGPVAVKTTVPGINVVDVESGREMAAACEQQFPNCDIAIMCAAVADYTIENPSPTKIKREGNEPPEIKLVKNPDIARNLGQQKRAGQLLIGFALETNDGVRNAHDKMARKNLDAIVLNTLGEKGVGFGTDTNRVSVFINDNKSEAIEIALKSKRLIAADLADIVEAKLLSK